MSDYDMKNPGPNGVYCFSNTYAGGRTDKYYRRFENGIWYWGDYDVAKASKSKVPLERGTKSPPHRLHLIANLPGNAHDHVEARKIGDPTPSTVPFQPEQMDLFQ